MPEHIKTVASLTENFATWKRRRWVHYSDFPELKFQYKRTHQDPLGLYFFPEAFTPRSNWLEKPYRFVVTLKPGVRILDLGNCDEAQLERLMRQVGAYDYWQDYLQRYPKDNLHDRIAMAWESMSRYLIVEPNNWTTGWIRWNKLLREAGYDAVFDDTGIIHSFEAQLLLLQPGLLASITKERRQGISGFAAMQTVLRDLEQLGQRYGTVSITPPRRKKARRQDNYQLEARFEIARNADNYANFLVYHNPSENRATIGISLSYSNPRLDYGVGIGYNFASNTYDFDGLTRLSRDLDKIFTTEP